MYFEIPSSSSSPNIPHVTFCYSCMFDKHEIVLKMVYGEILIKVPIKAKLETEIEYVRTNWIGIKYCNTKPQACLYNLCWHTVTLFYNKRPRGLGLCKYYKILLNMFPVNVFKIFTFMDLNSLFMWNTNFLQKLNWNNPITADGCTNWSSILKAFSKIHKGSK